MQSSRKLSLNMPLVALCSGALLALMIKLNSQLAVYSSPLWAAWIAHGIGAVTVLFMLLLLQGRRLNRVTFIAHANRPPLPWWAYVGGIPGAITVVFAAITVNSELALAGTLALMLLGQLIFSCVFDCFGYFGMAKRRIQPREVIAMMMILFGAMLVIFAQ